MSVTGGTRRLALVGLSAIVGVALCAPAAQAQGIEVYSGAGTPKVNRPASGGCTPAAAPTRFEGTARNGAYSGHLELAVRRLDGGSAIEGVVGFSDGLGGEGTLTGTLTGPSVGLRGQIDAWPGGRFVMTLDGTLANGGMAGRYTLARTDGSNRQTGDFSLTGHQGVDGRLVGAWAMEVPGHAIQYDLDRGSYIERISRVGAGAAGLGVIEILADGRYVWTKHGERYAGQLGYCTNSNGQGGWSLAYGRETLWALWVSGAHTGLVLANPGTTAFQYLGTSIRPN